MVNEQKARGDAGEREVESIFRAAGFRRARRALGAGRRDDVGDIDNVRELCVQVVRVAANGSLGSAILRKLPEVEVQRNNRRTRFGVVFARQDKKPWIVVMTPFQFLRIYKYALIGIATSQRRKAAKMSSRDNRGDTKAKA